jgi:hypothetical protein
MQRETQIKKFTSLLSLISHSLRTRIGEINNYLFILKAQNDSLELSQLSDSLLGLIELIEVIDGGGKEIGRDEDLINIVLTLTQQNEFLPETYPQQKLLYHCLVSLLKIREASQIKLIHSEDKEDITLEIIKKNNSQPSNSKLKSQLKIFEAIISLLFEISVNSSNEQRIHRRLII